MERFNERRQTATAERLGGPREVLIQQNSSLWKRHGSRVMHFSQVTRDATLRYRSFESEFIYLTRPLGRLQNRAEFGIRARLKRVCVEQHDLTIKLDYGTAASSYIWMLLIGFEARPRDSHEAMGLLVEPVLGPRNR